MNQVYQYTSKERYRELTGDKNVPFVELLRRMAARHLYQQREKRVAAIYGGNRTLGYEVIRKIIGGSVS